MSHYEGNAFYPSSGGGGKGDGQKTGQQATRPMTIKQVLRCEKDHTDQDWMLDNEPVQAITIVARVMAVRKMDTQVVYQLTDTSDEMECRYWLSPGEAPDDDITENGIVRVLGSIRNFNNRQSINASHVRRLDVFKTHLVYTQGLAATASHSAHAIKPDPSAGPSTGAYNPSNITSSQFGNLPPISRAIVEYLMVAPGRGQGGMTLMQIVNDLKGRIKATPELINSAIDDLTSSGVIYNTDDELHFDLVD
ncbi:hypothetical protein BKA62DRAFT_696359 [Auriculariales sp. MPI-PUGE-AT-0066]|nr:hypothetical protein BKA62DRAFT_696359 [Auriculariales sp. MPI-PUGE-AT-0066]